MINHYQIIDNFLSKPEHTRIFNVLCNTEYNPSDKERVSWIYSGVLQKQYENQENSSYNFMFVTSFPISENGTGVNNEIVKPLIKKLNPLMLFRIKANLYTKADKIVTHGFHLDFADMNPNILNKMKTAVYFVNTNDGKLLLSDGTEIKSVANRIAIFNGNVLHSGTTCTDSKVRCVININFLDMNL